MGTSTPWGTSDSSKRITPGITFYSTPSHGGFKVCPTLNAAMPDHLRRADGWYEEDCDWCLVVVAYPRHFPETERESADHTLKNWHPAAWEIQHGRRLEPGESFKRDQELFREANRGNYVAISAVGDWADGVPPGMVGVWFKVGGRENVHGLEIRRLIPAAEYDRADRFGFVLAPGDVGAFQPYTGKGVPK